MKDPHLEAPRDRLEEYLDGLLPETECLEIEAALARDPVLREELAAVRRFDALMHGMRDPGAEERAVRRVLAAVTRLDARRGRVVRILAAAAAAILVAVLVWGQRSSQRTPPAPAALAALQGDWVVYGKRLGTIAAERREGRVPRTGLTDLEVPPARASGIVFSAALGVLGERLDAGEEALVQGMVAEHFQAVQPLGEGVMAESLRSEASLSLYRRLRNEAGAAVADAFYDVFRPGVADLNSARRVPPEALPRIAEETYVRAYTEAVGELERRYGAARVAVVLDRLAPSDARTYRRDAVDEGEGRDAALAMRARLYRAAHEAGAERLYIAR